MWRWGIFIAKRPDTLWGCARARRESQRHFLSLGEYYLCRSIGSDRLLLLWPFAVTVLLLVCWSFSLFFTIENNIIERSSEKASKKKKRLFTTSIVGLIDVVKLLSDYHIFRSEFSKHFPIARDDNLSLRHWSHLGHSVFYSKIFPFSKKKSDDSATTKNRTTIYDW